MTTAYVTCEIDRFGIDIELDISARVASWGSPPSWDDPGEGPEWDEPSVHTMEARLPIDWHRDLTKAERDKIDGLLEEAVTEMLFDPYDD